MDRAFQNTKKIKGVTWLMIVFALRLPCPVSRTGMERTWTVQLDTADKAACISERRFSFNDAPRARFDWPVCRVSRC